METNGIATSTSNKRRKTRRGSQTGNEPTRDSWNGTSSDAVNGQYTRQNTAQTYAQSPTDNAPGNQAARSCGNCRRCKLRCSREDPCNKCVLKGIPCMYEHDKRRGPRPGYIEELYRRIDTLEHMVIGQSLILPRRGEDGTSPSFHDAVLWQKSRLKDAGLAYLQSLPDAGDSNELQTSPTDISGDRAGLHELGLNEELLLQLWETYRHMIQPWIPVLHQTTIRNHISTSDKMDLSWRPILEAIFAAAGPLVHELSIDSGKGLKILCRSVFRTILTRASMEQLQAAVVLKFLMLGDGHFSDTVGLMVYLPQLALRAGLHLEDHHLSSEQREYRRLISFVQTDKSWAGHEGARRLFWNIFLLDQTSAILSGVPASFDSTIIGRLLPCDGKTWLDNEPIHTREFVPASVAVQAQILTDYSIGGFAYLIEATEILKIVTAFALKTGKARPSRVDQRSYLQEFLNLDLILMNCKSRLPARFQRVSHDENGYMDHNVTLAHLSHNTSVVLLYQSSRKMQLPQMNGNGSQSPFFPPIHGVKQAAKEIAKICTRFLVHRQYLVSPQFAFCQFMAARALLAYAYWNMEAIDEDFDILFTSLGESAQRWKGTQIEPRRQTDPSKLDNFAGKLMRQLKVDVQRSYEIDLTTPCTELLNNFDLHGSNELNTSREYESSHNPMPNSSHHNQVGGTAPVSTGMVVPTIGRPTSTNQLDCAAFSDPLGGLDSMTIFQSAQFEEMGDRIFSWQDGDEFSQGGSHQQANIFDERTRTS